MIQSQSNQQESVVQANNSLPVTSFLHLVQEQSENNECKWI